LSGSGQAQGPAPPPAPAHREFSSDKAWNELPEKYQGVEVDEVREMIGTMKINQVNKGAIYTLKGSSKAALELADQQGNYH
jgi:hypothetical protein